MIELDSIGVVRSRVTETVDEGWGEVVSEIQLREELADGLLGLDEFSHVLVVYYMHKATFDVQTDLRRRPRGRSDMPLLGCFAQRARHRPNPIGITAVRLLAVEGPVVRVQGLDAVDGTPVLDLKPYLPSFDSRPDARTPAWVNRLMEGYFG